MAIVDLEYEEWQKNFEAEQPHLFTESNGLGPQTRAVAERRDLMRIAYSAGKAARGKQQGGEVQGDAWTVAELVRTDLDKQACPDHFMRVAVESVVKHLTARRPVGQEPVGEVYQGSARNPQAWLSKPLPIGTLLYATPPAQALRAGTKCNCHPETCACDSQLGRSP